MLKYEYYEVVKHIKNLPFKSGDFIRGYKLGDQCILGDHTTDETYKKELVKAGYIKRISKAELTRILLSRHTY